MYDTAGRVITVDVINMFCSVAFPAKCKIN